MSFNTLIICSIGHVFRAEVAGVCRNNPIRVADGIEFSVFPVSTSGSNNGVAFILTNAVNISVRAVNLIAQACEIDRALPVRDINDLHKFISLMSQVTDQRFITVSNNGTERITVLSVVDPDEHLDTPLIGALRLYGRNQPLVSLEERVIDCALLDEPTLSMLDKPTLLAAKERDSGMHNHNLSIKRMGRRGRMRLKSSRI